ncbi:S1/P1 nuclease-domain-containing protein [Jimgerdemannia flammicorona]|uniref:S1/P1 nuclease-domain-containing protein n=1 Tax=Jimgerdemannia flammicorona TaxID=994334 RepID=A0A433D3A1_9FUNG|nr:S1/P1 nuclease-domain-containing protein [Jimgerdemannia flammicorona]
MIDPPSPPPPTMRITSSRIAAWADKIRMVPGYRFALPLHFINPPKDYPPNNCNFEWVKGHRDVVNAIYNYTNRLGDETLDAHQREDALKFLVHFMGDLHNPLHSAFSSRCCSLFIAFGTETVTGRDRGGNSAPAIFEGHHTKLHRVWDSMILNKQIRELDGPYLTYVLNLLKTTWRPLITEWVTCPELPVILNRFSYDFPYDYTYSSSISYLDVPACPELWGAQINALNCEYVWRDYTPELELSDGEYWERISTNMVEEKLIAMAGIRIAAILNSILGGDKGNTTAKVSLKVPEEQTDEVVESLTAWSSTFLGWIGQQWQGRLMRQE